MVRVHVVDDSFRAALMWSWREVYGYHTVQHSATAPVYEQRGAVMKLPFVCVFVCVCVCVCDHFVSQKDSHWPLSTYVCIVIIICRATTSITL